MKKNRAMRLAALLLVAVLMSTCGISGTFAKYVTSAESMDTARVAKWGVSASVKGDAFAEKYEVKTATTDKDGNAIVYSVESTTNVVAPGTDGTFTGVAVTGAPEVAVNVNTEATISITGFEITTGFYCPIVITVNGNSYSGLDYASAADFVTALENAIETANGNYQANTDLSGVTGLNGDYAWNWAFEGSDDVAHLTYGQTDGKDTELGNWSSKGKAAPTITITVKTTITQID